MTSIMLSTDKLSAAAATQFIVEKESHRIAEADNMFYEVTGLDSRKGIGTITLESLLSASQSAQMTRALNGRMKRGSTLAYTCLLKGNGKTMKAGIITLQPHNKIDGNEQVMCILTAFDIKTDSKPKNASPELRTIEDLKKAIDNDEFVVYAHPIFSLNTDLAVGGEILTHWEKSGKLMEGFFPHFEEEEMSSELDFYILTRSLQAVAYADSKKSREIVISFNLSNQNFRSRGFVERIGGLVEAFEIEKHRVILECVRQPKSLAKGPQEC
ncbi:MAG: EAL domain-containing protein [Clostridia bacterium]|nr:EAL domain-containing protein [Clostridia bacterium]